MTFLCKLDRSRAGTPEAARASLLPLSACDIVAPSWHSSYLHITGAPVVDVLDRVLDKGLVIAGDIRVSLAEVELLTIRIRLRVCSLDKAQEIGLDWWRYDRELSSAGNRRMLPEQEQLRDQLRQLERKIDALASAPAKRRR